jgi:hypothetical protein
LAVPARSVGCLLADQGASDPLARLAELRDQAGLDGDSPETAQQRRMVRRWVQRANLTSQAA